MTDVMAHEVVIGCLVRLALVVEGDTAQEVLSVLEQERGRARVRERLGRGAIGPMEEVVAKVGAVSWGWSFLLRAFGTGGETGAAVAAIGAMRLSLLYVGVGCAVGVAEYETLSVCEVG